MSPEQGQVTMYGTVQALRDHSVRALVEYGAASERMLCDFPRSFWPSSKNPEPFQRFVLRYAQGAKQPSIEVLGFKAPTFASTKFAREARQLLGFQPGDKVLVVVGPSPEPRDIARRAYWLVNAGWGEALALTRLPFLLTTIGILPKDIETMIVEAEDVKFDPERYAGHHIVFLGSTVSNIIMRQYYWSRFGEISKIYQFTHEQQKNITRLRTTFREEPFTTSDNLHGSVHPDWDTMQVHNYYLLARVNNPYAKPEEHRQCILSCGIGTIGTGYGVVVLSAREAVRTLLDQGEGRDFHMVGDVNMVGFFNPSRDPTNMLWFNGRECGEQRLLKGSMSSLTVWADPAVYTEEDEQVDRESLSFMLERHRDERIAERLSNRE